MRPGAKRMVVVAMWAATAAMAAPAVAGEITWKAEIWGPKRASAQAMEWYAKEVAAKTNGQMKLEFVFEQGKATEALDALKTREMTYFCVQYHAEKLPLLTVIELPMFAPDSPSVLGRVELALVDHPTIQAELKKLNMKILLPVALPQYQLMSTKRIAKVDDLQGIKVRMSAEMGKILEEYGATTKVMTVPEAVTAMKSGALDTIALAKYAFITYKVHETAKYMTEKISLGSPLCALAVNQKAWDALPPKVQEVMMSLRQPAVALYEDIFAREEAASLAAFKANGVEIVGFSAADRARLVAKSIKHWQAWVEEREKQGQKGREIFEFVQTKIREFSRK